MYLDESTSNKYDRDPDDEDTLSPVMVPIASPDSSCHSNSDNEFNADHPLLSEEPVTFNFDSEIEKKSEPIIKKVANSITVAPVKRPRSPVSNQVCLNFH